MLLRRAKPAPPFDRSLTERQRDAVDREQRLARLDVEDAGARRDRRRSPSPFPAPSASGRRTASRRSCTSSRWYDSTRARVSPLNSSAGSVISSSTTGWPEYSSTRRSTNTASPGGEVEVARRLGARLAAPHVEEAARRVLVLAVVAPDPQEPEHRRVLLGVRGDERALALPAHDEVVGGERVDRLAHGALRDAEASGELDLARNRLAGLPVAGLEALLQQAP